MRLAGVVALLVIAAALVYAGVRLRQWAYGNSVPIRFQADISNAWKQGSAVLDAARQTSNSGPVTLHGLIQSYLTRYDAVLTGSHRGVFRLDYPPARLLVMSLWVWQMDDEARSRRLTPWNFPIVWPLLCFNALLELAGCTGAYLLVRHVLRRQQIAGADLVALIAPALMWFNLPAILDAHVWPQWEVWIIPFYTFAAYFAATRRWLAAGMCIAIGAMFKGQMLITAAVFVMWPLFQLRWRGVIEVIVGALFAAMVFALPWMLRTNSAALLVAAVLTLLVFGLAWMPRGWRMLYLTSGSAIALLAAGLWFDGSFAWWIIGFERGTQQYMSMNMGPTPNLAALLHHAGWSISDEMLSVEWPSLRVNLQLTTRQVLLWVYGISLVLCGIGVAHHDARNDRRVLIALATPWLVMFAALPQMHERYLVWAGVLTALGAAVSLGGGLMHLVVALLAALPVAHNLLNQGPGFSPEVQEWADATHRFCMRSFPDAGWATLLASMVLLYLSLAPSRTAASRAVECQGAMTLS
jgi:hypothetical protein